MYLMCVEGMHLQSMHLESDEPFTLLPPPPFQTSGFPVYKAFPDRWFCDLRGNR